jgi:hypothetical protein
MVAGEGLTRYPPPPEARYSRFGARFGQPKGVRAPLLVGSRQARLMRATALPTAAGVPAVYPNPLKPDTDPRKGLGDLTLLNGSQEAKTKSDPRTA